MTTATQTTHEAIAPEHDIPADVLKQLEEKVIERLRTVFDPEIPVNIYDLGLIYRIDVQNSPEPGKYDIFVDMTLTTPNCPVAGQMPAMAQMAIASIENLNSVKVDLTFNPPWDKARMTDEARLTLNMF